MMVYFRRFAGLTSFDSKRWRSHFSASGPPGILASRGMVVRAGSMRQVDPDRNEPEPATNDDRQHDPDRRQAPCIERMVRSDRLEPTRNAVPEMQAHDHRADHVEHHPEQIVEHLELRAIEIA